MCVCVQVISPEQDTLYVVEVLVHCSKESVKNASTEAAKPAGPGEKGEMQVGLSQQSPSPILLPPVLP